MSKTLPLLYQNCQVVPVRAHDLKNIGTLTSLENSYLYAWVYWPHRKPSRESIFAITTPADWQHRHVSQQESVADRWTGGV